MKEVGVSEIWNLDHFPVFFVLLVFSMGGLVMAANCKWLRNRDGGAKMWIECEKT